MVTTFVVVILVLSVVLAFAAEPGKFQATVLLFGILVAAVIFTASRYKVSGIHQRPDLEREVQELRRELAELRQPLATGSCGYCGATVPMGALFCPQCGARQSQSP